MDKSGLVNFVMWDPDYNNKIGISTLDLRKKMI